MIFGLRLTTKRELMLWASAIEERDRRILELESRARELESWSRAAVKHEQGRAEAAINILLTKTQNVQIRREPEHFNEAAFERAQATIMNMFGSEMPSQADEERAAREIAAIQAKP